MENEDGPYRGRMIFCSMLTFSVVSFSKVKALYATLRKADSSPRGRKLLSAVLCKRQKQISSFKMFCQTNQQKWKTTENEISKSHFPQKTPPMLTCSENNSFCGMWYSISTLLPFSAENEKPKKLEPPFSLWFQFL